LWVTINSADVEIKAAVLMPDAGAAQQLTTDMQAESQKQAAASKAMMAILPMPAPVKTLLQELSDTQQFTTDGTLSVITMKVTKGPLDGAMAEISNMASMSGGAAAPPPGHPPAGPGVPRRGRR